MMFGNNNGNGNGVNVNTAFYTSYSDTSLLSVGGWNRNLSLKIQPAVGKDANGLTQYASDKTSTITTSIREENALALLEGFNKYIKPAIENENPHEAKVTIAMGSGDKKKALSIIFDGKDSYLELAIGLSEVPYLHIAQEHRPTYRLSECFHNPYCWERFVLGLSLLADCPDHCE